MSPNPSPRSYRRRDKTSTVPAPRRPVDSAGNPLSNLPAEHFPPPMVVVLVAVPQMVLMVDHTIGPDGCSGCSDSVGVGVGVGSHSHIALFRDDDVPVRNAEVDGAGLEVRTGADEHEDEPDYASLPGIAGAAAGGDIGGVGGAPVVEMTMFDALGIVAAGAGAVAGAGAGAVAGTVAGAVAVAGTVAGVGAVAGTVAGAVAGPVDVGNAAR
jgi:hypothetical protein